MERYYFFEDNKRARVVVIVIGLAISIIGAISFAHWIAGGLVTFEYFDYYCFNRESCIDQDQIFAMYEQMMTWHTWANWGFAFMLLGIFMTVFWFAIGSMHYVRLCEYLGKLFHVLLVLLILGFIGWFLVGPFIFWGFQPRTGCCDFYIWYSARAVRCWNHIFCTTIILTAVLLVAIFITQRKKRNEFRF